MLQKCLSIIVGFLLIATTCFAFKPDSGGPPKNHQTITADGLSKFTIDGKELVFLTDALEEIKKAKWKLYWKHQLMQGGISSLQAVLRVFSPIQKIEPFNFNQLEISI